ncbi:MAG TPA: hypothetical protein VL282_12950 [Tepidisphaeraceae bacterium]|nr:hypothetical protein [Tepidisphaeraceae bacterium]
MSEHPVRTAAPIEPDAKSKRFYCDAMQALDRAGVPYLVGGGFAMAHYTGIARNTKDLDLFVRPSDRDRLLTTLTALGYKTEFFYPFWIAKVLDGDAFIDVLYNSGNGVCLVDDEWFEYALPHRVLDYETRLVPVEEQLWSKAFVQDRDRFDGADVHHLILNLGHKLDWHRLLRRFEQHERVLLPHLLTFGYVYPSEQDQVPAWVMDHLETAIRNEPKDPAKICRGTQIAQRSYWVDTHEWGYHDARVKPYGPLTPEEGEQLPPPM